MYHHNIAIPPELSNLWSERNTLTSALRSSKRCRRVGAFLTELGPLPENGPSSHRRRPLALSRESELLTGVEVLREVGRSKLWPALEVSPLFSQSSCRDTAAFFQSQVLRSWMYSRRTPFPMARSTVASRVEGGVCFDLGGLVPIWERPPWWC